MRLATVALLVLALLLVPSAAELITTYWWFQELGLMQVFTRPLLTKIALFIGAGGSTALFLLANFSFAQRGIIPGPIVFQFGTGARPVDVTGFLKQLSRPVALALGALAGFGLTGSWETLLLWIERAPVGTADPVFAHDLGWYLFSLPVLSLALGFLRSLITLGLITAIPVYAMRGDIVVLPQRLRIEPSAGHHLAALLAAWFVTGAAQLWFVDTSALLYSTTGPFNGASYTDLHATLPALRVSAFVGIAAAIAVIIGAARRQVGWFAFLALGAYAVVGVIGRGVIPAVVQKFVVAPTELTRETPYLAHHIEATRRAWGIDSVERRDLEGEAQLTLAALRANGPTLDNVRLWDRAPLLRTFKQLQEIRTYYDFVSIDDDRYWIDGRYRQVLLSPRELNVSALPTRTFINEHLTFTHGMGLTLSPVNEVTAEGLPVLFVQDLPPRTVSTLKVERPQMYFGELTESHVFVNTRQKEFDYPAGEANVFRAYTGTAGVPVSSLARRALFALRFGSSKILLAGDFTPDTRVLFRRNIVERVREAVPFVTLDRDPYLVIAEDGTLHWMLDAYTTSARYPYAYRASDGVTYMRNSVKITVDAYHGAVSVFAADSTDPILSAWSRIFPDMVRPLAELRADLRAHLRYPDDLFRRQTALYTTYHMDTPEEFYNREDQWQIPSVDRSDGSVPFMRHIIMRLPDEDSAEFIYMAPFTPRGKDNLAAWMIARNDGDQYGRLRVYQFPRQSLVFGPRQVENRISQDTEISRQISLWDQRGSQVIKGDLLVIPINSALLYVQPLYLQAEGGRIPELKRVIVAYKNQVVMRETLDQALSAMFGDRAQPATITTAPTVTSAGTEAGAIAGAGATARDAELQRVITEARRRYTAAIEAQRDGDWARYGEELRQLGQLLERLESLRAARP